MGGEVLIYNQISDIAFTPNILTFKKKKIDFEKVVVACGAWSNDFLKKSWN